MVIIETITKHYYIFGERIPIELKFYDNGYGLCVVAKHNILNLSISTTTGENMDTRIAEDFEKMILGNMERNNIENYNEYLKEKSKGQSLVREKTINIEKNLIIFENPDNDGENSFMIGINSS